MDDLIALSIEAPRLERLECRFGLFGPSLHAHAAEHCDGDGELLLRLLPEVMAEKIACNFRPIFIYTGQSQTMHIR